MYSEHRTDTEIRIVGGIILKEKIKGLKSIKEKEMKETKEFQILVTLTFNFNRIVQH